MTLESAVKSNVMILTGVAFLLAIAQDHAAKVVMSLYDDDDDQYSGYPIMSAEEKAHLKLFDRVGVECHVGDHDPGERRCVIAVRVAIYEWTSDKGKTAFVFMGGGTTTYQDLPRPQSSTCR